MCLTEEFTVFGAKACSAAKAMKIRHSRFDTEGEKSFSRKSLLAFLVWVSENDAARFLAE